jgi:hypothetical protein
MADAWDQFKTKPQDPWDQYKLPSSPSGIPSLPTGKATAKTGPELTEKERHQALGTLPFIGGTIGSIAAPEVAGAGWLLNTAIAVGSAALGGAAGSAAEQEIKAATKASDRPQSFGAAAKTAGEEALGQGLGEVGGRVLAAPFSFALKRFAPSSLYRQALKPSINLSDAESKRIVQAGLAERIPVSETGYQKLTQSVRDLSNRINSEVANKSTNLGGVIDPKVVTDRLDSLIEHYKAQAYPDADIKAIESVRDSFLKRHSYQAPYTKIRPGGEEEAGKFVAEGQGSTTIRKPLSLSDAQAEKQGTYRFNQGGYGQLGGAQLEAEKTVARTLREQIVALFPEINVLNQKDKAMIELEEQLQKAVAREGKRGIGRMAPAAIGGGAGLLGGLVSGDYRESGIGGAILTGALIALDDPEVKSKLAFALAKAAKNRLGQVAVRLGKEALPAAGRAAGSAAVPSPKNRLEPPQQ